MQTFATANHFNFNQIDRQINTDINNGFPGAGLLVIKNNCYYYIEVPLGLIVEFHSPCNIT